MNTKRKLRPFEYDTHETFDQFCDRYYSYRKQYMEKDEISNAIDAALSGDIEDIKYRLENGLADAWKVSIKKVERLLNDSPWLGDAYGYLRARAWAAAKKAENGYGYYWPWVDKYDHESCSASHLVAEDDETYYFYLAREVLEHFEQANGGFDAANIKVADAKDDNYFHDGHGVLHYNEDGAWIMFNLPNGQHFKYKVFSSDHLWVEG